MLTMLTADCSDHIHNCQPHS